MTDAKELIDAIDQLDAEFSGKLNDICVSKAEVIAVVQRYFAKPYTVNPDIARSLEDKPDWQRVGDNAERPDYRNLNLDEPTSKS